MLILLKFRARPRSAKAKIGEKLHTNAPSCGRFTKSQSALGSETDSALVSKKIAFQKSSGMEILKGVPAQR
jgi:hypothetical protein